MGFENIVIRLDDFEVPLEQPRLIEYDSNQHDPCYRDITFSGCVDLCKMRRVKTAVSPESLVHKIEGYTEVYVPVDIMAKALKEYFDKIFTINNKE